MSLFAHVEVAPLVPAQLVALLAVVTVVLPARLPSRPPSGARGPVRLPGLSTLGLVGLAAVVALAATGQPRTVFAAAWLVLAVASTLAGPIWRPANPLRLLATGLAHVLGDREEKGTRAPPEGWWPAAVGLAVLLWLSSVPLAPEIAVGAFAAYLLVQLGAVMLYGQDWLVQGDAIEALSTALGDRLNAPLLLAVPAGIGLHTQLAATQPWRQLTAPAGHPGWLAFDALLAVAAVGAAAGGAVVLSRDGGGGLRAVAVGYLVAWAVTILLPVPPLGVEDPTTPQVVETFVAAFGPALILLVAHGWAARLLGRISPVLAASAVAGVLLFGPW